jgi:putative aldouronate transport system substrate-binding protein
MALPLLLAVLLLPVGCTGKGTAKSGEAAATTTPVGTYPVQTDVTLSYWLDFNNNVSPNFANLGDTPFAKALISQTGIKITYQHPPASGADEQFNIMVADGNLPDIMERNWMNYPGGPEKAITDGVIIRLNDVIDKYCPNLKAYLKANPNIDKMIKTDNGSYYCFPFIRGHDELLISRGLFIRQDWLDELGLNVPVTIDDWHTVLTAFKTRKNVPAPFSFEYQGSGLNDVLTFAYAYDSTRIFYVGDDGKVHFGAIEPNRRTYLTTFAQWYKEGLVDPDVGMVQSQQVAAKMTGGQAGASMGWLGSRMGTWTTAARTTNPNYKLVAAPIPVLRPGDKNKMSPVESPYSLNGSAAITGSCKNVEIAARLLDYAYGAAGTNLYNFGIEGESYTVINGFPTYTDVVTKNPKGWPISQGLGAYVRSVYNGPFIQQQPYIVQYLALPEQKDALKMWTVPGALKYVLPPITPTPEESREFARIMNEINTYRDEMELKFIIGTENLNNWDNYVRTVTNMGITRALEIQNAALTRYNAR